MDTSETAVMDRMKNLTDQASALTITADLEKTTAERVDLFYKFVEVWKHGLYTTYVTICFYNHNLLPEFNLVVT